MKTLPDSITRLDYCQYLLSTQINYTLTNFAEHSAHFSHDAINRYLAGEQITPRLVWENVQAPVVQVDEGYLVFDDTVIDKNFSQPIDLVRRQYSGNAHGLIKGVGVVTCVYVNPTTGQFWIIDYRARFTSLKKLLYKLAKTTTARCGILSDFKQVFARSWDEFVKAAFRRRVDL